MIQLFEDNNIVQLGRGGHTELDITMSVKATTVVKREIQK